MSASAMPDGRNTNIGITYQRRRRINNNLLSPLILFSLISSFFLLPLNPGSGYGEHRKCLSSIEIYGNHFLFLAQCEFNLQRMTTAIRQHFAYYPAGNVGTCLGHRRVNDPQKARQRMHMQTGKISNSLRRRPWRSCLPYFHTWCGLSANLECRSDMCCTRLAANAGPKRVAKNRHLGTIAQLCRAISSHLRHVSIIGKNMLSSNISPTCPHNMVNLAN